MSLLALDSGPANERPRGCAGAVHYFHHGVRAWTSNARLGLWRFLTGPHGPYRRNENASGPPELARGCKPIPAQAPHDQRGPGAELGTRRKNPAINEHPKRSHASDSSGTEAARPKDLFEGSPRFLERIDQVLSLVRKEWLAHPDERFWQMTANLAARMGITAYAPMLEDDAFIEILNQRGGEIGTTTA